MDRLWRRMPASLLEDDDAAVSGHGVVIETFCSPTEGDAAACKIIFLPFLKTDRSTVLSKPEFGALVNLTLFRFLFEKQKFI